MNKPLLSIVIATKNRQKYAISAIESIMKLKDDKLELVIQDNSDEATLKQFVAKYSNDSRLIYNYTNKVCSAIENFNDSINNSNGEYTCLIGDDDGINPEIIVITKWAKENNIDAVSGNLSANYRWGDTGAPDTLFTKSTGSTLTLTHFSGKAKQVDLNKSLNQLMKNGATNYLEFLLPKLYHGVVRKSCLELIKNKTGEYVNGLSPDIYAAVTLALTINKLIYIDYPLTIPGVCAESGSIKEGQLKNHSKKLEDAPHLKGRPNYNWSEEVPRLYTPLAIWADSCIAAIKDMNRADLMKNFSQARLYSNIIDLDKTFIPYIRKDYINSFSDYLELFIAYTTGPVKKFITNRVWGRTKKILKIEKYKIINNLDNIDQATEALVEYLSNENIQLTSELDKSLKNK